MEYDRVEPFGSMRDNLHAAMIALLIRAANTPRGRPMPKLEDFLIMDPKERQERNVSDMVQTLRAVAIPRRKREKTRHGNRSSVAGR